MAYSLMNHVAVEDLPLTGTSPLFILDFVKTHDPKRLYAMVVSNDMVGSFDCQEGYKTIYNIRIDGRTAIVKLK